MTAASQRAKELLVDQATEGLDSNELHELEALLPRCPDLDPQSFVLAAAAVDLAFNVQNEPLPDTLRNRLSRQANDFYRQQAVAPGAEPDAASSDAPVLPFRARQSDDVDASADDTVRSDPSRSNIGPDPIARDAIGQVIADHDRSGVRTASPAQRPWLGWVAAAAATLIAVAGWWPASEPASAGLDPAGTVVADNGSDNGSGATDTPETATSTVATPEAGLDALLASTDNLVRLAWTATEDVAAQGASGEVVWSTEQQRGFMTFSGLAVNDPQVEQYQLWIFDSTQDERYPVDGGVFDIGSDGSVIVEIDAKLAIVDPTLFAITVEKPGGVVVSSRERLPLLAQVG